MRLAGCNDRFTEQKPPNPIPLYPVTIANAFLTHYKMKKKRAREQTMGVSWQMHYKVMQGPFSPASL
jgi:hypothetical protein